VAIDSPAILSADDWSLGIEEEEPEPGGRPYLAAAGRLVEMKGFQRLIP